MLISISPIRGPHRVETRFTNRMCFWWIFTLIQLVLGEILSLIFLIWSVLINSCFFLFQCIREYEGLDVFQFYFLAFLFLCCGIQIICSNSLQAAGHEQHNVLINSGHVLLWSIKQTMSYSSGGNGN